MRIYIAVILLLAAVLAFSLYSVDSLHRDVRAMTSGFDRMEKSIEDGRWDAAAEGLAEVRRNWSGSKDRWAIIIDHREIDDIDMAITRITKYIDMRDQPLAAGEAAILEQLFMHIPEKEKVNLKNIL